MYNKLTPAELAQLDRERAEYRHRLAAMTSQIGVYIKAHPETSDDDLFLELVRLLTEAERFLLLGLLTEAILRLAKREEAGL
jgi:hypothetical protein